VEATQQRERIPVHSGKGTEMDETRAAALGRRGLGFKQRLCESGFTCAAQNLIQCVKDVRACALQRSAMSVLQHFNESHATGRSVDAVAEARRDAIRQADWNRLTYFPALECNAGPMSQGMKAGYFVSHQGYPIEEHRFDHVYVHGDLHGDIELFFEFLKMCNIATFNRENYKKPEIEWMMEETQPRTNIAVIFVGDVIDRFRPSDPGVETSVGELEFEEKYLERAINDLSEQAQRNGSIVIKLFGNHEFLNRLEPLNEPFSEIGPKRYMSSFLRHSYQTMYPLDPNPVYSRVKEFQPGNIMNYEVGECNASVIFQLNQHVFVHGGISLEALEYADRHGRHLYELANTVSRAIWNGTATADETYHFYHLVNRNDSENSLLWDRTFSEVNGPPSHRDMSEYISAVISRLNEHNTRFHVPTVLGIVVAHTWPGMNEGSVSEYSAEHHLVCRKNGTGGAGYVIFSDTNASRSFFRKGGDPYQRERRPKYRVRPLHITEGGNTEIMFYDEKDQVSTQSVPV